MKRIIYTSLSILAFAACCIVSKSCANTTTPPSGGPKDTIPPVLLKAMPENNTTNFPVYGQGVSLLYDEYTVVKNQADIFVSPPTKRKPKTKIKGKNIVLTFQDTLEAGRTYTIDFGQSLADNNEGNLAPRFVYTFSTGETIDSMYFTGTVKNSQTLSPVKGIVVTAYSDLTDSACFKSIPDAAVKTDDWGYFVLRNIKPVPYRIYAYTDSDGDYKYDPDSDEIAFLDTVYTPSRVVADSIPELYGTFQMKDTLECKARESMISLATFKELQSIQYLQNSGRKTNNSGFLKFSAADVRINSLEFMGIPSDNVILQYNATRDSIDFWINVDYKLEDSLMVKLNYMKTDSTGVLAPATENLSLAVMRQQEEESSVRSRSKNEKKEKDTVFAMNVAVENETVEQKGVSLSSALPVIGIIRDSIRLTEKNPKGQTEEKPFTLSQDTIEIRKYRIMPDFELVKGYEYVLVIPQGTFTNLDKLPNSREEIKFQIPSSETLCSITLDFKNVDANYIVDLTPEKGEETLRQHVINANGKITIKYLKAGTYRIRLTRDRNGNGLPDTGNLLEKRQPEAVRFYQTAPESTVLQIPEASDIEQTIDIKNLFE